MARFRKTIQDDPYYDYMTLPQENTPTATTEANLRLMQYGYDPNSSAATARKDDEFAKWQLNVNDILIQVKHELKGEYYDPETDKWQSHPGKDPMMNDYGVAKIVTHLKSIVNTNTLLSDLTVLEKNRMAMDTVQSLILMMMTEWEDFGMKDSDLIPVVSKFKNFMIPALNRALGGRTLDHLEHTTHRFENVVNTENVPNRGGFMNFFKKPSGVR